MHVPMKPPSLPLDAEDWLFLPPDVHPPPEPDTPSPASLQVDVHQWLADRKLNASPSTHQWLNELQSECANEEEGYGVLGARSSDDHKTAGSISSDIEILSHGDFSGGSNGDNGYPSENGGGPDSSSTKHMEHVGRDGEVNDPEVGHVYFEHVQGQPAAQWLTHGNLASSNCPYLKMTYFAEISNNLRDWLQSFGEEMKVDEDRDVCCTSESTKCCNTSPTLTKSTSRGSSLDIENIHELVCVQPATSPTPKRKSTQKVAKKGGDAGAQYKWRLTQGVADLCKANEPCETFAECCSPDNCCSNTTIIEPRRDNTDKNRSKQSLIQEWLQGVEESAPVNEGQREEMDMEQSAVPFGGSRAVTGPTFESTTSLTNFNTSAGSKVLTSGLSERASEFVGFSSEWLSHYSNHAEENKDVSVASKPSPSPVKHGLVGPYSAKICSGAGLTEGSIHKVKAAFSEKVVSEKCEQAESHETSKWLTMSQSHGDSKVTQPPVSKKSDISSWLRSMKQESHSLNKSQSLSGQDDTKWLKNSSEKENKEDKINEGNGLDFGGNVEKEVKSWLFKSMLQSGSGEGTSKMVQDKIIKEKTIQLPKYETNAFVWLQSDAKNVKVESKPNFELCTNLTTPSPVRKVVKKNTWLID